VDQKAKSSWQHGIPEPAEAEASGLLQALNWLKDSTLSNIVFEIDCKIVADGFQHSAYGHSDLQVLLNKCNHSLSLFPNLVEFD